MTRDELVAALQALPDNLVVCVTLDNGETLEAGYVEREEHSADEGGPCYVIHGVEDLVGIFGEPRRAAVPEAQYRM